MANKKRQGECVGPRARISYQQLVCLAFILHFTAAVEVLPTGAARVGGSGGWLAPFISLALGGLPVMLLVGALLNRHPGEGLGVLATNLLGKAMGRLVALLLALFSLTLTTLSLRDVAELVPVPILPETPMLVIAIAFMLVATYGAYTGAEVLARAAVLAFGLVLFVVLLALTTLTGTASPLRVLPLIERDISQPFLAGWPGIGWYAEVWSFYPLAAMVDKTERTTLALALGGLHATTLLGMMIALAIAVFGADLVAVMTFPFYSLVQQITIGEFVERLDVFIFTIWLFAMLVKVGAHLWIATDSLGFVFGMKNERRLLPILSLAAIYMAMQIPNLTWLVDFSTFAWTPISLGLGLSVPGLLLVVSWIRGLRERLRRGVGA